MTEEPTRHGANAADPGEITEPAEDAVSTGERLSEIFQAFEEYGAAGATEKATFLLKLTGEDGGDYLLTTSDGTARVEKAATAEADVAVTLPAEDLVRMADGQFDGRLAVASERIEIEGDLELAAALLGLIEPEEAG